MINKSVKFIYFGSCRFFSAQKPAVKLANTKPLSLITTKRSELNLMLNDAIHPNAKFGSIPLVSNGWAHRKSKGDFFIIHPISISNEISTENNSFINLNVNEQIIENLNNNEIRHPTDIQIKAIENISKGEHTLIAAETGCGKTYAYLIPVIQNILELKSNQSRTRNFNTPLGLILTPGRELAEQIGDVAKRLGNGLNLNVKVIIGGRTKQQMLNPTFEDVDLIVGSVGAVSKLVTTGIYRMNHVRHVILDEADTLLDDSFNEKLVYFLSKFPFHKNHLQTENDDTIGTQLILASATMPINIEELVGNILNTQTLTEVVSPNLHKILTHVKQRFIRMNKSDRPANLLSIIKEKPNRPVIVFSNKSTTCDFISIYLNEHGVNAVNLNGDMLMKIRVGQFDKFQNGEVNVLTTTDIGSRGLDTTRARRIINFDFPLHVADYIHRCGRTGRVGSPMDCQIINFVSSLREIDLVQKIEHTARTSMLLPDVNGNITNIIKKHFIKQIDREMNIFNDLKNI